MHACNNYGCPECGYGSFMLGKAMVEQSFHGPAGHILFDIGRMEKGESITLKFTRTDADGWMTAPGQKLIVEKVCQKKSEKSVKRRTKGAPPSTGG